MPDASASKPTSRAKAAAPAKAPPTSSPTAAASPAPRPTQPGMGAVPHADGTTFRVWAPHAEQVTVIGTFNDWDAGKNPLAAEGNGYWATDVPAAKPGDEYKFHLHREGQEFDRMDPYARQVTN